MADWSSATSTERNNAGLVDDNGNQTLSAAEIEGLRSKLTGAGVIAALEAASSTFAGKTEFSQVRGLGHPIAPAVHHPRAHICTVGRPLWSQDHRVTVRILYFLPTSHGHRLNAGADDTVTRQGPCKLSHVYTSVGGRSTPGGPLHVI